MLTVIGGPTFKLLENLLAPAKPADKSYAELTAALKAHLAPKPLVIAERYRFHKRDQHSGKSISQYFAELRRLARDCNCADYLDTALHDHFICGLHSETICKKLLAEEELTLRKAEHIVLAMEIAAKDAPELMPRHDARRNHSSATNSVHKLKARDVAATSATPAQAKSRDANARTPYIRCCRAGHRASECRCKEMECLKCGKRGHIAHACLGGRQRSALRFHRINNVANKHPNARPQLQQQHRVHTRCKKKAIMTLICTTLQTHAPSKTTRQSQFGLRQQLTASL